MISKALTLFLSYEPCFELLIESTYSLDKRRLLGFLFLYPLELRSPILSDWYDMLDKSLDLRFPLSVLIILVLDLCLKTCEL